MRILAVATCLAMPAPVAFACPTLADLDKGIRFTVDGVDTEVYRRVGPAMIEATYTTADGAVSRTMLAQGIYLVELVDMVDGKPDLATRTTYAFPGRAEDLALPSPGGQVVYDIVISNGNDLNPERQTYDFGPGGLINFGACEYEMVEIQIRYDPGDEALVDILYYLPALQFSYYAGSDSSDGPNRYSYTNMEVVE
ncbi:hypothetical protein [Maliponia aquimaris]|uniref:DUF4377 domain-containing protein n=1 Tax=Maliponia aquimaris TaxID=1673631 RepID=A0A238K604_9RHOB|nr:hypothetical protein [Maliponia aquimaris]SMX38255.1 hypothetical protein MAA8898_01452 [Maliponia aquimaris]